MASTRRAIQDIIFSDIKKHYLDALAKPRTTKELAIYMNVCWKSSHRRLSELKKLELIERDSNKWRGRYAIPNVRVMKEKTILGIDEAGREPSM